jgi:hypothetical protein
MVSRFAWPCSHYFNYRASLLSFMMLSLACVFVRVFDLPSLMM